MFKYATLALLFVSSMASAGEVELAQTVLKLGLKVYHPQLRQVESQMIGSHGGVLFFKVDYNRTVCGYEGDDTLKTCAQYACSDSATVTRATGAFNFEPGPVESSCKKVPGTESTAMGFGS